MKLEPREMLKDTFLLIAAIVLGVSFVEVGTRLFVPVRNVGPAFSVFDPIYGKRTKNNFKGTRITPEFTMTMSTNSKGFRGPELPDSLGKPILFIGDSMTMGFGVNDGEEFPGLIRDRLKKKFGNSAPVVINAGIGNVGLGRWVKFLRREGKYYKPHTVVLQLNSNDFQDDISEGLFSLSSSGEVDEVPLEKKGVLRSLQPIIETIPGLSQSYLIGLIQQALGTLRARNYAETNFDIKDHSNGELTYRLLETIISICQKEGYPIITVAAVNQKKRLAELKTVLDKYDVPLIVSPSKSDRKDLYYAIDGHWNKRGHSVMADKVYAELMPIISAGQ